MDNSKAMSVGARLKFLTPQDYPAIFPVVRDYEPFSKRITLEMATAVLRGQEGWSVWAREEVIGVITLSHFQLLHSAVLHCVIDPKYHRRWATRRILREVFGYIFGGGQLDLIKLYSFAIVGVTYDAALGLDALGFKREGVDRQGFMVPGTRNCYDLVRYSMLREECKWIR